MVNGYIQLNILLSQKTTDGFSIQSCICVVKCFVKYRWWNELSRERYSVSLNKKLLANWLEASLDYRILGELFFLGFSPVVAKALCSKLCTFENTFLLIYDLKWPKLFQMCLCLSSQTGHASTKSCVSPTRFPTGRFPSKRYVMESSSVGFCLFWRRK
jgi:hypothetical protein